MKLAKRVIVTASVITFGSMFMAPLAVGAAGALLSGGNSCTAAAGVTFTGSDQLTGMSAKAFLDQFSKDTQTTKLQIATQIYEAGVGRSPKEPPKAIAVAIAAGIQETNLTNETRPASDGSDSAGVFQERPSKGWGTRQQVLDVKYASNKWFDTLDRNVKNVDALSMIDIAIAVENPSRSAYHSRWNWDKTGAELLAQVAAPGATTSCKSTGWELPLEAKSYSITDGFGMRFDPVFHRNQLHDGVDLGAAKNTPIHAAHSGTVTLAGLNGSYGNYVGLDNGNGVTTGYGHMTSVAPGLKKGDQVTVGQVIGYVGSTGASTGNHLHFLVHLNGKPSDPIAFMDSNGVSIKDGQR